MGEAYIKGFGNIVALFSGGFALYSGMLSDITEVESCRINKGEFLRASLNPYSE